MSPAHVLRHRIPLRKGKYKALAQSAAAPRELATAARPRIADKYNRRCGRHAGATSWPAAGGNQESPSKSQAAAFGAPPPRGDAASREPAKASGSKFP